MNRSRLPTLAILGFLTALGCFPSEALADKNSQASRPNILLILTDDQRADTIAALGNPMIKTPNLDRLAKRGLAFDRAYVQGSMQGALCYAFDLLPTLASRCGITRDNPGESIDLNATLSDPDHPARERLLFAYRDLQRAITIGRWKLIRYPRIDRNQLFDLETDPDESHDLSDKPEYASRIAELTDAMESEMLASGDSAPLRVHSTRPALWKPPTSDARIRKTNIVFILADDLGYTDTGCYGSSYYETPHIDRLASQGMRLLNHHHCPNCTPTRAALMSGQYGARTGVYTVGSIDRFDWSKRPLRPVDNVEQLPLDRDSIAGQLRLAGYSTGMFGKWSNRILPSRRRSGRNPKSSIRASETRLRDERAIGPLAFRRSRRDAAAPIMHAVGKRRAEC